MRFSICTITDSELSWAKHRYSGMQAFVSATNKFALACIDGLIGPAAERQIVPPAAVHTCYGRSHVDDVDRLPASQT